MNSKSWERVVALAGIVMLSAACSEKSPSRFDAGGSTLDVNVIMLVDLPAGGDQSERPDGWLPDADAAISPDATRRDGAVDAPAPDAAADLLSPDTSADLPTPDSTVDLPTPDTVPDSVTLHRVTIVGGRVEVEYSKNFAACTDMLDAQHNVLHSGNALCASGDNQRVAMEISDFTRPLLAGDEVYLCRRNRCALVNSSLVLVERKYFAFTSSQTYQGNFGGLGAADGICQADAAAAGLAGSYKAILSDQTTNAKDRLTFAGAITDTSGREIATGAADLWDGSIARQLNTTATKAAAPYHLVWSCTRSDGTRDQRSTTCCGNWTSVSGGVETGSTGQTNYRWIALYDQGSSASNSCSNQGLIYCVEQ